MQNLQLLQGVGKSTLLNIIQGLETYDSGEIEVGETIKFGYFSQKGLIYKEDQRVLVADIGHNIRTPLATITATAELIRATTADAGQDERLALVVRQAHRIDSLVTDLVRTHGADDPALALAPVELLNGDCAAERLFTSR